MNRSGVGIRVVLAALLLGIGVFDDSRAASYEEAVRAYERGEYKAAAAALQPIAEAGDPKAQVRLGLMYREGRGVGRDPVSAFQWLLRAARGGRADAQYLVGTMYQRGEGTPRDNEAARAWWRRAAAQGNQKAAAALKGATPGKAAVAQAAEPTSQPPPSLREPVADPAVAADTQSVLAAMDPPPSEAEIAAIQKAAAHGIRVVDGPVSALKKKDTQEEPVADSSSWRPAEAPTSLQDVMRHHANVPRGPLTASDDSTPSPAGEVVAKPAQPATRPSMQGLTVRAQAGDLVAQRQLAAAYLRGSGVPRDPARAAQWYRKAAVAGDAESQYVLSGLYFKGVGVPRDPSVAIQWLRRAAAQGHSGARAQLTQSGN
jgi:TPR repeat protein